MNFNIGDQVKILKLGQDEEEDYGDDDVEARKHVGKIGRVVDRGTNMGVEFYGVQVDALQPTLIPTYYSDELELCTQTKEKE